MKNLTFPFKAAASSLIAIEKLLIAMLNTVLRLLGVKPIPMPTRSLPQLSTKASDVIHELKSATTPSRSPASDKLLKPTSEAGHTLYRYACATSMAERATMDLSALSPDQQFWLYQLSDADLSRLSKAGLDACTRAMDGKKCGVGGLPKFEKQEPEAPKMTSPLAERIYAYKAGYVFA